MRRIAFHLNCLEQGGAERVVTNLAHQFYAEGYEVLIATEWFGENEFQIDEGIQRVHVGLTQEDQKKSRPVQILRRVTHLRRFVKEYQPDGLHSHNPEYPVLHFSDGDDVRCVGRVLGVVDPDQYANDVELEMLEEIRHEKRTGK